MKPQLKLAAALLLATLNLQLAASPLGTTFTYQGRLGDGGSPANGSYDLKFTLCDADIGTGVVAGPLTNAAVAVSNGLFTVVLDFGAGAFSGSARWLEIGVRPNGVATDFTTLSPRQPLSPSPYALYSSSAGTATTAGTASVASSVGAGSVTGAGIAAGTITADKLAGGQVVKTVNGLTDDVTLTAGSNATVVTAGSTVTISAVPSTVVTNTGWGISGNSGTTPGANFLGTTDNQPLELKVNGQRALRLEPNANGTVVMVGASNNWAFGSGATIAGGYGNSIQSNADYSTIAGGYYNLIQSSNVTFAPKYDFIGGGTLNTIEPFTYYASMPGGYANRIQYDGSYATIAGGVLNVIGTNAFGGAIGGGRSNVIGSYALYATIPGGISNTISGSYGFIGGGWYNTIEPVGYYSAILGGVSNRIQLSGDNTVIAGGLNNLTGTNADSSAIGGGQYNTISNQAQFATIPGGSSNTVGASYSLAAGQRGKANHTGTFVWADSQGFDFPSTANNQFLIRANGGVGINKNSPFSALDVNGTVTASGFSGPASGLYSLNANNISGGTLSDSRLSSNIPELNANQTFTGANAFAGAVTATNAASQFVGAFTGNGAGLTNLSVSGPSPYTALLNANQTFTAANAFAGVVLATNPASLFAGAFSGDGGGLTNLNASQLVSGTILNSRLPAEVALLNANQAFTASNHFSSILVATNSANVLGGTFNGNGGGLTNLNASKLASGTLPDGRLSGTYSGALTLNNAANSFSGSGANLTGLNAGNLDTGLVPDARLGGLYQQQVSFTHANNSFTGSGAGLYSLKAGNIASGNLADARLSANVALRNAVQTFSGALTLDGGAYLDDHDLYFRGDTNHGLAWYGGSRPFASATPDGPVLYGCSGGGLGTVCSGPKLALAWDNQGNVFTDPNGLNDRSLLPGLTFGPGSGEGISSRRTSGDGQHAIDFYTGGALRMTIDNSGNVGIGTNSPRYLLDVAGTARVNMLAILGGSDVAEPFTISTRNVPKGAVVVIDEHNPGALALSDRPYDQRVAGIVSGANGINPGLTLQQEGLTKDGQNVALSGRVYALADASGGPINPGDLLTTSGVPGHCMRVGDHARAQGAILGKAMTGLTQGRGMVLVLVTLQ